MSNTSKILVFSSCLALFLVGCSLTEKETIKIGYIGPLTGGAASYGSDTSNAAKMKVAEVNAAGGINGQMIELIVEDSRCTSTDAAAAVQKLVNIDKVVAIVGGQCSGETLGAAPIVEEGKVVLVSPVSSSPDITSAGDFIFRVYPSDSLKGVDMAAYMEKMDYMRIAIITENTDYAVGIRDSLNVALPEGYEIVFDEVVVPDTKDFRSLMARLENVDHDVFISNPQSDSVLAPMVQQYRESGFEGPIVSQDIADSMNLLNLAPEAVEGMYLFNPSSLLGTKANDGERSFVDKFREQYGEAQSNMSFATLGYDSAGVILEAIGAVGTDGEAIRDYLYATQFEGAAGTFSFDENGDVVGISNVLKKFEDGKIIEVTQ